jgi:hypothetical protein
MSLQFVADGEVFTVRTYKRTGDFAWANTYEIRAREDAESNNQAFWQNIADRFIALEREFHLNTVLFDRVVISTYIPDGQPYNPVTFTSFPYAVLGLAGLTADQLPADACLYVRRNALFGRDGRLLYRGCLHEGFAEGGFPRHTITTTRQGQIQGAFNSWYAAFRSNTVFDVVMASGVPVPTDIRVVTDFVVERRIVYKKPRNRYFDRVRNQ